MTDDNAHSNAVDRPYLNRKAGRFPKTPVSSQGVTPAAPTLGSFLYLSSPIFDVDVPLSAERRQWRRTIQQSCHPEEKLLPHQQTVVDAVRFPYFNLSLGAE